MTKNLDKKDIIYIISFGILCLVSFFFILFFSLSNDIKLLKNDNTRVNNFGQIERNIDNFLYSKKRLPKDLNEISNSDYETSSGYYGSVSGSSYKDPKTGNLYDYKPANDSRSYQLCTTFEIGSEKLNSSMYSKYKFKEGYDCVTISLNQSYIDMINNATLTPTPTLKSKPTSIYTPTPTIIQQITVTPTR